jgi:hypothetical protein
VLSPLGRARARDKLWVVAVKGFPVLGGPAFPGFRCPQSLATSAMSAAMMAGATASMASLSLRTSPFTEFNGLAAAAPSFRPSMPSSARPGEFHFWWFSLPFGLHGNGRSFHLLFRHNGSFRIIGSAVECGVQFSQFR